MRATYRAPEGRYVVLFIADISYAVLYRLDPGVTLSAAKARAAARALLPRDAAFAGRREVGALERRSGVVPGEHLGSVSLGERLSGSETPRSIACRFPEGRPFTVPIAVDFYGRSRDRVAGRIVIEAFIGG